MGERKRPKPEPPVPLVPYVPTFCEHTRVQQAMRKRGYARQQQLGVAAGVNHKSVRNYVSLHSKTASIDSMFRMASACRLVICMIPAELAGASHWKPWVCEPCVGPDPNRRKYRDEAQPLPSKRVGKPLRDQWDLSRYGEEVKERTKKR